MSLKSVIQQLRALPYTEMKVLAGSVQDGMEEQHGREVINYADVLSTLSDIGEQNQELKNEAYYLAKAFIPKRGGRRQIEIRPLAGGVFEACYGDWKHADNNVRSAVSGLLDLVAGYEALKR